MHVIMGTGPVGMSIMEVLREKGEQIRMVNRSGKANVPVGVELRSGDAMDADFVKQVTQDATHVYQALNPPYTQWVELFPPLQANVLEGAASAGAKLVSMENLYGYGSTHGVPMREDTPLNPNTKKGRVRTQMTQDLFAAHNSGKVQALAVRASDFFGPRVLESAMGNRVFPQAMAGKSVSVLGNPDKRHSYSYMPDVAKTVVAAALDDAAYGKVWHVPSVETLTTRQFVERVFVAYGQEPKVGKVPILIVRLMGLFNPLLREVLEMLYEFEEDFEIDASYTQAQLGVEPTPLDEAIATTANWYRDNYQG